mmetsp:Transcript_25482/g.79796  ORF Transcript_25482/g.79796 Transcript_25482/m.79796 type:complete len:431 (+) Transcript_25482:72-1364(+)
MFTLFHHGFRNTHAMKQHAPALSLTHTHASSHLPPHAAAHAPGVRQRAAAAAVVDLVAAGAALREVHLEGEEPLGLLADAALAPEAAVPHDEELAHVVHDLGELGVELLVLHVLEVLEAEELLVRAVAVARRRVEVRSRVEVVVEGGVEVARGLRARQRRADEQPQLPPQRLDVAQVPQLFEEALVEVADLQQRLGVPLIQQPRGDVGDAVRAEVPIVHHARRHGAVLAAVAPLAADERVQEAAGRERRAHAERAEVALVELLAADEALVVLRLELLLGGLGGELQVGQARGAVGDERLAAAAGAANRLAVRDVRGELRVRLREGYEPFLEEIRRGLPQVPEEVVEAAAQQPQRGDGEPAHARRVQRVRDELHGGGEVGAHSRQHAPLELAELELAPRAQRRVLPGRDVVGVLELRPVVAQDPAATLGPE